MKRGGYALDLKKQIKVRIDNITFERLNRLSQENNTTISSLLRTVIIKRLEHVS